MIEGRPTALPGAHAPAPTSPPGGALATADARNAAGVFHGTLATRSTALPRSALAHALLIIVLGTSVAAQTFTTPSGLPTEVAEVILDDATGFARFRFIAPTLGSEGAAITDITDDFQWICETLALPSLASQNHTPEQIIISIADRDVPFGTMDADATQYFTGFTTDGETCTEELF